LQQRGSCVRSPDLSLYAEFRRLASCHPCRLSLRLTLCARHPPSHSRRDSASGRWTAKNQYAIEFHASCLGEDQHWVPGFREADPPMAPLSCGRQGLLPVSLHSALSLPTCRCLQGDPVASELRRSTGNRAHSKCERHDHRPKADCQHLESERRLGPEEKAASFQPPALEASPLIPATEALAGSTPRLR
jgi:hypothetical protein